MRSPRGNGLRYKASLTQSIQEYDRMYLNNDRKSYDVEIDVVKFRKNLGMACTPPSRVDYLLLHRFKAIKKSWLNLICCLIPPKFSRSNLRIETWWRLNC